MATAHKDYIPRLTEPSPEELALVRKQTEQEREWYGSHERFADTDAIIGAFATGRLVSVTEDANVVPIFRFRESGDPTKHPPYLLPNSAAALSATGRLWRQESLRFGIGMPEVHLAATSFVRSETRQAELVAEGALAVPDSTHCVGAAFDIDASSYYKFDPEQGYVSVPHPGRDREKLSEIEAFLVKDNPDNALPMQIAADKFDSRVLGILLIVTAELHAAGYINRVVEFPGDPNQCLHIAPNPAVPAHEWDTFGIAS